MTSKIHCPICAKELDSYMISGTVEAFHAQDQMEGLTAYGPYGVPKDLLHEMKTDDGKANYVHIRFVDNAQERLVVHHV